MAKMWLSLLLSSVTASLPFITTWSTKYFPGDIVLPTISAQSLVTIDWGDNSANSTIAPLTNATDLSHEYAATGLYNVSILGEFRWISPASGSTPSFRKLVDIVSWGDGFLIDENSASNLFGSYFNLQVSASPFTQPVFLPGARLDAMFDSTSFDSPLNWDLLNVTSVFGMFAFTPLNNLINFSNTQGLTSLSSMFNNTPKFNQPVTMDIPNVVSVDNMFYFATAFNQPVTLTNSQKLTSTLGMFSYASSFNQPFTLDTRAVTNMENMFSAAVNFNQPLTFDTSSVTTMQHMFIHASSFNQTLNFSSTANVQGMNAMFVHVPLFEQDLASWNTSSVTDCSYFCPRCGLPAFPLCGTPCADGSTIYTNEKNMSVCYSLAPTGAPSTPYPTSQPTSHAPTLAPSVDLSTVVSPAEKPSVRAVGLIAVVVAVLVN